MKTSLVNVLWEDKKTNVAIYGASMRQAGVTHIEAKEFHIRELDLEISESSLENVDAIILMKQLIAQRDIFAKMLDHCRMHSTDIYDQYGKKLNIICEEAKSYEFCTREALMEQIAAHDCISFDIFDTLLTRRVMSPDDVFDLVGRKLCNEGIKIRNFKEKRIKAQEESGLTNPSMKEIYARFCKRYKLSEEVGKRCMEMELAIESSVLVPRREMAEIYQNCVKSGKNVSLITDMYIPGKQLESILKRNGIEGYSAIYVSCDKKQLKLQGLLKLYREETEGTNYLHIGDHFIHDGICAALADIDYCLVASGDKLARRAGYGYCMEQACSLEEHVMLGMVMAKIFNSPFIETKQEGKVYIYSDYNYGYAFCAPLISQYVKWLYEKVVNNEFDDILFASRDGYLIQKLYNILCEKLGNSSFPHGIYFYTSRKASVMTGINSEAYINMLIDMSQQMPPQKMMRERFGLEARDILVYDKEKYGDSIHKYVWDHKNAIFSRAESAKKNFFKYMSTLQLQIGAKYAFMDFVSSGTSQKSLARIVPFELYGLYTGWSGSEAKESVGVQALFEKGDSFFMGNYKIMETFMTSYEPSVSHFDENGKPVFSRQDRSRKELEYVSSMQQASEDYLCELLELLGDVLTEESFADTKFVDNLFSASDRAIVMDENSVLNHLRLMDDWRKRSNRIFTNCLSIPERIFMDGILGWEQDTLLEESGSKVGELLLNEGSLDLDDALYEADWDVFYQLSPMREGLLNWYSFSEGCHILELSNGYGGITGVLCRNAATVTVLEASQYRAKCISKRYADRDNLIVKVGDLGELPPEQRYDYVVVERTIDTREQVEALLDELSPFLMNTGRLLFACSNRFGMKYWCGVPDPINHKPFGSLGKAVSEKGLSRQGLILSLKQNANIEGFQLYYPFPDERLPQAIYTDEYLPKASIRDRVIPYYTDQEQQGLVCLENDISDELVENQVLPFFANTFLVECAKEKIDKKTIFAALSTDRGREHGFATVIAGNGVVHKIALFPEGIQSLELICQNQQELCRQGVPCVEQRLIRDRIEMPFVKAPALIEYLKETYAKDIRGVENIFDRLYETILNSSNHVAFENCKLLDQALTEQNAGTILEKAYIDMIPYNCFFKDGGFLFYDQEFVREGYPAKYVLFRALRYTYIYIAEAEQIIPLKHFKERYALTEVWDAFEREEARFVEDNRNYSLYASFYRWAGAKGDTGLELKENCLQEESYDIDLQAEAEGDTGLELKENCFQKKSYDIKLYKRDYKLKAVKAVQLQLLKEFDRVCRENDLSYCAAYGTLLGVIRHKGFVPWDDDLDLMMPRCDFDKLTKISHLVFNKPYFLQTAENDECFYGGYAKLRNGMTTGMEPQNQGQNCNQGIWIDILPVDDVLEDAEEKQIQRKKIQYYQNLLLKKIYPGSRRIWNVSEQEEEWYLETSRMFTKAELSEALHETCACYGSRLSDKVAVLSRIRFGTEAVEYDRADFEFLIKGQFEDMEIPIPVGYENCLKRDYGEEYMLYPGVAERVPHHRAVFDVKKSYVDYLS